MLLRQPNGWPGVQRVARAKSLAIPAIYDGLIEITALYREHLKTHFAPELEGLDAQGAEELLDAIQIVVSFESFDFARRRLGRDDAQIARIWSAALHGLFER